MNGHHANRSDAARRRAGLAATAVFVVGLVTVFGADAAHAVSTTCSFNTTTHVMTVSMTANGLSAEITRSGALITVNGGACGTATVNSTDQIVVNGDVGRQSLEINLANGPLAPGVSPESDTPEIEITPHLGAGTDRLTIDGTDNPDNFRIGTSGINLNGDSDADVTLDGVDEFYVNAGGSADHVSEAGGLGTGGVFNRTVTVYGGDGADVITGGSARDYLNGDAGADVITGGDGPDYIYGGTEGDTLSGGDGNDYMYGDAGDDTLYGNAGDDEFNESNASNGADTFIGGSGSDEVTYSYRANPINVTIDGTNNDGEAGEHDNVKTDVENVIGSGTAPNTLVGSSGDNYLYGGSAVDNLSGGAGDDNLYGYDNADHLQGGAGDDSLSGGNGPDTLDGNAGNDDLYGGDGNDTLNGDDGDDYFFEDYAANGADDFSGGAGRDSISYSGRTTAITVTMDNVADDGAASEGDRVRPDVEIATGGMGKNHLVGSAADNNLYSPYNQTADDYINGGGGVDLIYGYGGDDTLIGGDGEDSIYAGDGNDTIKVQDGGYDYVDGGAGTDTVASQDAGIDNIVNVP
jgi:Ca2+-binding RTX toxin-like protein